MSYTNYIPKRWCPLLLCRLRYINLNTSQRYQFLKQNWWMNLTENSIWCGKWHYLSNKKKLSSIGAVEASKQPFQHIVCIKIFVCWQRVHSCSRATSSQPGFWVSKEASKQRADEQMNAMESRWLSRRKVNAYLELGYSVRGDCRAIGVPHTTA